MPVLIQVCIVAGTLALVAVAVALVRAIGQLRATAAQLERTMARLDQAIPEVERTVVEARGVLDSLGKVASRADALSAEFATTGGRLARASSLIMDEVVDPATKIAALVRGVRAGATTLVGSFLKRGGVAPAPNPDPGGNHHE